MHYNNLKFGARAHDLIDAYLGEDSDGATEWTRELANIVKDCGLQCVQLAIRKSLPNMVDGSGYWVRTYGEFLKTELAENGVDIAVLGYYHNLINPRNDHRNSDGISLINFVKFASISKTSKIIGTETGSVLKTGGFTLDNFTDNAFSQVVEVAHKLPYLYDDIIFAIEPGLNHPIYSIDTTSKLIDEVDNNDLGVIFDPFNFITKENVDDWDNIISKAFAEFGDRIVAIHLKDFALDGEFNFNNGEFGVKPVSIGHGVLDFKDTIDLLSELVDRYSSHSRLFRKANDKDLRMSYELRMPVIFEHSTPEDIKSALLGLV